MGDIYSLARAGLLNAKHVHVINLASKRPLSATLRFQLSQLRNDPHRETRAANGHLSSLEIALKWRNYCADSVIGCTDLEVNVGYYWSYGNQY